MRSTLSLFGLIALRATATLAASCIAFDSNYNLYALGFSGADYSVGDKSSWSSAQASKLATDGRPPFDGDNTQCFTSQFFNAIYVLDGDKSNPSNIHIYDATAKSWSTQQTNLAGVDPSSLVAILDRDTNVFFALSGGKLYQLDMAKQIASNGKTNNWESVGTPNFDVTNYKPVMALADNHIHFLDVPGNQAGQANIFVIHYAYWQPQIQTYSGSAFPVQHGKTASLFNPNADNWQLKFAYIPDDGSATYVTDVTTNTTVSIAGPIDKSPLASYAASDSAIVQLSSSGTLSYISFDQTNAGVNANAAWSQISAQGLPAGTSSGSSSGSASASASSASGSASASASASGSASASASATRSSTSGLVSRTTGSATGTATVKASSSSASSSASASTTPNSAMSSLAGRGLENVMLAGLSVTFMALVGTVLV